MTRRARALPAPVAVIDIGTNSIKLLVARSDGTTVTPVYFQRVTTRLGSGLGRSRRISTAATRRAARVVTTLARSARRHGAARVLAVGTYALRTAQNGPAVARRIARDAGVDVEVLTGRAEAAYAFHAARTALRRPRPATFILDVGGGSAQLAVARGTTLLSVRSCPLGALRLTERHLHTDPIAPVEYAAMQREVARIVARAVAPHLALASHAALIAVGGSATTALAMARGGRVSPRAGTLAVSDLRRLEARCRVLAIAQRRGMPGLPADHADIIPAGLAVVLAFTRALHKRVIHVSDGGVREGVILAMVRGTA
jgi:exopolyphosphatase/guanosine-5'-triphosphate,3'-diphosphate pyrophosphatase